MLLNDDITTVKGIGEKTALGLGKLGISSVKDLIYYFPRDYQRYDDPILIKDAHEGERVSVSAKVVSYVDTRKGGRLSITSLSVSDSSGSLRLVFFNSPFLKTVFHKGDEFIFVGTVKTKGSMRVMEMPEYYPVYKYKAMLKSMQPVYSLTKGITNNQIKKSLGNAREAFLKIEDYLSDEIRNEYDLISERSAIEEIHFPLNEDRLKIAIKRLAFDEFLYFLMGVREMRKNNLSVSSSHVITKESISKLDGFKAGLPFSLTSGQESAIRDIIDDMSLGNVMNRLIEGDVGSGKTIVATAALFLNAMSGYQGALMVPTEVLALQHYEDLKALFKPYKIRVELLTGSTSLKDKRSIYENLKSGDISILIGTHALIEDKTEFKDLGLVITDEQHRFGVKQRERLGAKGNYPHVLIMSATPIPRTLAMILYANLDISVIKELPKGRKKIKNCVVGTEYRSTAYKFIQNEIKNGHQAYVICPMVEESETMDLENVENYTDELRNVYKGCNINIEYIHGKMKDEDKAGILKDFINKKIDILVSTTVIEVGINNPNATVMMIENAERFGLAQLHQLRGRVGRGSYQSYCIFINVKQSKESKERLKVLEESNDGFYIATEDLKLRGPGDFFGVRQSGDIMFRLADIYNHADMLRTAQEIVLKYGDDIKIKY